MTMYQHKPEPQPTTINTRDVITLTARLAQLLAEEADHLYAMKLKKVDELQKEKLFLIGALEAHKKLIDKNPRLVDTIPSQDKNDLAGVVKVFEDILMENHRRLAIAREVNRKVVNTITQVVKETSQSSVYGAGGVTGAMGNETLSVTLNQTA